jgi:glycosyltransferase involved in cell wall biosynthesis
VRKAESVARQDSRQLTVDKAASLKLLVLSRNYPNPVLPLLGLWVERPTAAVARLVDAEVVSPVPWFPPLPAFAAPEALRRFRQVPRRHVRRGVEIHHPRFLVGPGYKLHAQEARSYYAGVHRTVRDLRRWFPFDLIHAHFGYPDGVVAERLGREHGVPVVVTEHAPWHPWMEHFASVRKQTIKSASAFARHIAVSRSVADSIRSFTGDAHAVDVIPIGVDEHVFRPGPTSARDPNKVLFVGNPRAVKGVDVLLEAMEIVVVQRPHAHLVLVGGALYRDGERQLQELKARVADSPLRGRVEFTGPQPPTTVARHMAESALLVLPSRLESFGAVLVEAMACGTPVVSTYSGGPEDIVTADNGHLVPIDDPASLAVAMLDVLDNAARYRAEDLRDYVLRRFTWSTIADRLTTMYRAVLDGTH